MSTVFLHPKRKIYYHRSIIPRRLQPYFKGRQQLWRSLKTNNSDEAMLKSLRWDTRAQRVFLTLKNHGQPYASITEYEGRAYKEHLLHDRGVSLATVATFLDTLSGLFTGAEKQGYMNEGAPNPVKGLVPSKTESEKDATDIRPFTDEELLRVFSSTNFLNQKYTRPDHYWITMLCLFHLCRREEVAQLALTDLGEQDGIPFIVITDLGEDQSLKNKGSKRKMPIPFSLLSLGFLDYVQGLKDQGHTRLFLQLQRRVNGYSDAVGKFFACHLDKLKLSEPELVMHSLRHGIHYFRALGCPQDVAEMLTGHSATSVHDKVYVHRELTPLTRLRDGLERTEFPAVLKALAFPRC